MTIAYVLAALASTGAAASAQDTGPNPITVTGENRIVCRRVARTATRMRTGRICRRESEWRNEANSSTPAASYDEPDSAYARASGTFEPCPYDGGGSPQTPLGPR